jgi:hypothetical protein
MLTFEQFLRAGTAEGGAVNLMFEERLFGLVEILHKVTEMFVAEGIPYELIGGMAVAAQIERVDRDQIMLTRDVDIMIDRADLERIKTAAERHGFHYRHVRGLDMLLHGVRLLFSGAPNPALAPEPITLYGKHVSVIPVVDLVRMKLNSFRDKDRVHVRAMAGVGLITPAVEEALTPELHARLEHVRMTE